MGKAKTEGMQVDKYVCEKLFDLERQLGPYFQQMTPQDLPAAEESGWRRRITVLLTMDEIPQAGPGGGRIPAYDPDYRPKVIIRGAHPDNKEKVAEALTAAAVFFRNKVRSRTFDEKADTEANGRKYSVKAAYTSEDHIASLHVNGKTKWHEYLRKLKIKKEKRETDSDNSSDSSDGSVGSDDGSS